MDIHNVKIRNLIEYAVDNGHRVKVFEKSISVDINPLYSYVLLFTLSYGDVCIIKYDYSDSEYNKGGRITVDDFKRIFSERPVAS
ncbi:hypothetical protein HBD75_003481 [Salmonella enterica]|nr:hypothetical protein [Salmonella enterica]EEU4805590.1 hypothetical protein [Salmonella enterica]EEU4869125.1 hypothetical protein [Salmonella enterica]EEU4896457.1 hypothetical protein [Salmonella enterica]